MKVLIADKLSEKTVSRFKSPRRRGHRKHGIDR